MKGEGAVVFLFVFVIGLAVTLSSPDLPVGRQIYDALGLEDTAYPIMGMPAPTFGSAILNGVIYGVIVWLIFTIARRGPKQQQPIPDTKPIDTL
jgi:hypothetical protein